MGGGGLDGQLLHKQSDRGRFLLNRLDKYPQWC